MSLFNLDGTAVFGAGSEWLWSMAQFILVAISLLGIYLQLRAQRSSSLYDQAAAWNREWNDDEGFMVSRLAGLVDLEGRPVELGLPMSTADVGDWFERLGYMVAQKHVRSTDVWHMMRTAVGTWWLLMGPYLEPTRRIHGARSIYEWFEALEIEMKRLDLVILGEEASFGEREAALVEATENLRARLTLMADSRNGKYPTRRPPGVTHRSVAPGPAEHHQSSSPSEAAQT